MGEKNVKFKRCEGQVLYKNTFQNDAPKQLWRLSFFIFQSWHLYWNASLTKKNVSGYELNTPETQIPLCLAMSGKSGQFLTQFQKLPRKPVCKHSIQLSWENLHNIEIVEIICLNIWEKTVNQSPQKNFYMGDLAINSVHIAVFILRKLSNQQHF